MDKAKSYSRQIKHTNQTVGAFISSTTMANVDKSSNQSHMPHFVEEVHGKEDILHVDGNHDVGGGVSGNKQVRIEEEMLEEIHVVDDLPQQKECKKTKRAGSFDTSPADPTGITSEYTRDMTQSNRAPQETNTACQQEVCGNVLEGSIQKEDPSTVGKKKKKRRQLAPPKAVSAQETTEPSTGPVELSKSTGDEAYNVELTGRDEAKVRASDLPFSSSELKDGIQGAKHVQFVSDAQGSTDLISVQGNFDHVHKGYRNAFIGDVIHSTAEVLATEGKSTKGSNTPWDGEEKHDEIKRHKHNEGSHDEGVTETNNVEKDGKSTYVSEKRHRNDNISQEKKRKKAKKVSSAEMASMDAADEKEMHGDRENAVKSDTVSTEREIVNDPSMQQITNNVLQGCSNITENPSGDGQRKKKKRRQSESLKDDPGQDLTKSSGFVTNESSIQHTNSAHLDAKQTTQGSIEGATVNDNKKLGESLDIAAENVIDEVLADLRSKDGLSKDLDGDMLTEQTHLGSNQNAPSTEDKVGFSAALPPKCPAAIHSDALVSLSRHKKSGKQVKALSTMIDSSHYSSVVPEEDANTKLNESDSSRFSDKTSEHNKDSLTGDVVAQADAKTKATRRQRKKVSLKQVPTDNVKATQSWDEQANQAAKDELKVANATEADLVKVVL
uniref:Uncharacterized protein n=1 Tax=Arundo donax TaxID=35708 RepID=A0A0A9DB97_ARUDO